MAQVSADVIHALGFAPIFCAGELEYRRYENDHEQITARQRAYNRRKTAVVRDARLLRFNGA